MNTGDKNGKQKDTKVYVMQEVTLSIQVFWDMAVCRHVRSIRHFDTGLCCDLCINPYPTAFPYGNSMVLHFYQQQESSTTKTVHRVINKGLKAYV